MRISILTNNSAPNSRAFNCPFLVSRKFFSVKGVDLKFFFKISGTLFNSDFLFINSNFFRPYWQNGRKGEIFSLLEKAKKNKQKICWFDTTDSTWCTQFEVLPYVDSFLKSQLLKDKRLYLKNFRTGRIFTDFFDELYKSGEKEESYPSLPEDQMGKIGLSWAPCFEIYDENRYSLGRQLYNLLRPYTSKFIAEKLKIDFSPVAADRPLPISARFGLTHSRPSVVAHRKAVAGILCKMGVNCGRIPLKDYFREMKSAKVSVSPYGVGEFCYRDYESIICGSALVKPDMSHMETWPDLYQPDKTYVPHKWDLSDLDEKLDSLLKNPEYCCEIAENAQKVYKESLSPEGLEKFAERLSGICNQ